MREPVPRLVRGRAPVTPSAIRSVVAALALLLIGFGGSAAAESDGADQYQLQFGVKIPLRDGVHLNATVYRPLHAAGRLPVILLLTPYPDNTDHPSGSYFARRGYVFAYVDVRGRGDSEGRFNPMAQEAQDGYDVVEWLARQSWSNGQVAMWGGSYPGYDQWATASLRPPHLKTIVPVASIRPAVDFPTSNGIMEADALQWLTLVSGRSLYSGLFSDDTFWRETTARAFEEKAPFDKLDEYAGNTSTVFQTWLAHPDFDGFWEPIYLAPERIAGIDLPVLEISGYRDDDEAASISFYRDHLQSKHPSALERFYLILGPWDHPGTRAPKARVWNEEFGAASLLDMRKLQLEWYDWILRSGTKPEFLAQHVAYYVQGAGAECWKYADSLDTAAVRSQVLYLDSSGGAKSVFESGQLQSRSADAGADSFVSDPNDLTAAQSLRESEGKIVLPAGDPGLDLHGNGVVYHSGPFQGDAELDGSIALHIWLKVDAPDTDLGYALYLITPDGKAHWLTSDRLRARYRHGLERAEAISSEEPEEYVLPAGRWFAQRVSKGSYLRLILEAVNLPEMQKNWNSMKPVSEQSGPDGRVATIHVLHDSNHPSRLILPLGDPAAACVGR
jgi:putative CocE/NonD family hydrolase